MAVSLLEARRQILLNTPHIESASGSIATFNTDLSANLTDMKIHFHPVQEGSGDPSPTNVRPITGFDGITVYHSGSDRSTPLEIPISFGRTIYGGYVDLVKGEVVEEWKHLALNGTESWSKNSGTEFAEDGSFRFETSVQKSYWISPNKPIEDGMASYLKPKQSGGLYYNSPGCFALYSSRYYVRLAGISEVSDLKAYLADHVLQTAYRAETPTAYPLTPQTIKSLKGINNIWSSANGNIEVKFWKH